MWLTSSPTEAKLPVRMTSSVRSAKKRSIRMRLAKLRPTERRRVRLIQIKFCAAHKIYHALHNTEDAQAPLIRFNLSMFSSLRS